MSRTSIQFFVTVPFSYGSFVLDNGASISPVTVRGFLMLLLYKMDPLDLYAHDKHLQRVKREEYTTKFNI